MDSPTGWVTTDEVLAAQFGVSFPTGTFSKATDVHGGMYDVRLESKTTLFGVVPGAVALGTVVGSNPVLPGGVAFTSRPATLLFYYKLSGTPAATASNGAFAQVALTRFVNGRTQTIATAKQVLTTPTTAYVLAQVPLTYSSGLAPDSLHLVFSSGAIISANGPTAGTMLQVDDVSFTGTVMATRDPALSAALQVSPNPSQGGRYLLSATPALVAAPLSVVDVTGRLVHHEAGLPLGAATRALDLSSLREGLYTLQVFTEQGLVTKHTRALAARLPATCQAPSRQWRGFFEGLTVRGRCRTAHLRAQISRPRPASKPATQSESGSQCRSRKLLLSTSRPKANKV